MRRHIVLTTLVLTVLVATVGPVGAGQDSAGIWTYDHDVGTTFINLTSYNLKMLSQTMEEHDGGCPGTCANPPFSISPGNIGPMRSWQARYKGSGYADPLSWEGKSTWAFDGDEGYLSDSSFEIVAVNQTSAKSVGDLHHGTWFSLSPIDGQEGNWKPAGSKVCSLTANAVDDKKMHNVMNLINDKVIITFFSPDNKNLVIVAMELNANVPGWDQCNYITSYPLDFVDNASDKVPGQ